MSESATSPQWLQRVRDGQLWDFPGGIHPAENKQQSNQQPPRAALIPSQVVVPVKQHHGQAGQILVTVGEPVLKGQPLTAADNRICAPIHAPTSGTVTAIGPGAVPHPSGLTEVCITIDSDGEDRWCELAPVTQWQQQDADTLRLAIRQAGITGLGGASFPTAVKLDPPHQVQLLLINGVECEPYITADDVLMRHYAEKIVRGIDIMSRILQPGLVVVAIEDNKPQAIAAMQKPCDQAGFQLRVLPTKYPSGSEKQLINLVTGREVPSGSRPADIGIVVQNTGTAFAVQQAVELGKPLIERVVTVTGNQVTPHNRWTLIGTPISTLLADSDFRPAAQCPVIVGGPMMGFTLHDPAAPLIKGCNCLLLPGPDELSLTRNQISGQSQPERACIRCSSCADACPARLLPQQLYWFAKSQDHQRAQEYRLQDCIECGACAYVCPSQIPLVHYYRKAKAAIRNEAEERARAEQARIRFEARQQRQEAEKAERLRKQQESMERQRKKREEREAAAKTAEAGGAAGGKPAAPAQSDVVAAAMARVKARKARQAAEQQSAKQAPSDKNQSDKKQEDNR